MLQPTEATVISDIGKIAATFAALSIAILAIIARSLYDVQNERRALRFAIRSATSNQQGFVAITDFLERIPVILRRLQDLGNIITLGLTLAIVNLVLTAMSIGTYFFQYSDGIPYSLGIFIDDVMLIGVTLSTVVFWGFER